MPGYRDLGQAASEGGKFADAETLASTCLGALAAQPGRKWPHRGCHPQPVDAAETTLQPTPMEPHSGTSMPSGGPTA